MAHGTHSIFTYKFLALSKEVWVALYNESEPDKSGIAKVHYQRNDDQTLTLTLDGHKDERIQECLGYGFLVNFATVMVAETYGGTMCGTPENMKHQLEYGYEKETTNAASN